MFVEEGINATLYNLRWKSDSAESPLHLIRPFPIHSIPFFQVIVSQLIQSRAARERRKQVLWFYRHNVVITFITDNASDNRWERSKSSINQVVSKQKVADIGIHSIDCTSKLRTPSQPQLIDTEITDCFVLFLLSFIVLLLFPSIIIRIPCFALN